MKFISFIQKQISEENFKIFCCFVNALLQICIVRTNKCISKIPRIFCKNIICRRETECPQIFNEEYCCGSCITFSKDMNLPQS